MGLAHGTDRLVEAVVGAYCLQTMFGYLFTSSLLADGGVGALGAEEGAGALEPKTALDVLADMASAGVEQGIGDAFEVLFGNKHHQLVLAACGLPAQWFEIT